ncbi:hypothetical protein PPERSA_03739 [Pseudocohnilembus persalinus]|uniref:Uncharacterized protein n=1 Tax=Pseudocohnilembus persalinus TaxID=266149 RepID=A0A0V0QHF4_PSEPJ|nr:hypothetical protein PPERSA_03739 [Pseudocohnilembus persalinus]|eukprot:KRX01655.1 hypothetical protein PPERSA_03739 [Pseudocohnilembus persalinus]
MGLQSGAQITELEMILEGERRKFKEQKDKLETDLSKEKKLRIEYENKLMQLRQEYQNRETLMSELEFKNANTQQENSGLVNEMRNLKEEMMRMQDLYNNKIGQLEDKLLQANQQVQSLEKKSVQEKTQLRDQFQVQVDEFNKQWEYKCKGLEEKSKSLFQIKGDLENEVRNLNDTIMKLKIEAEEEMRERITRIQEEEYRKYTTSLRAIEQKLRAQEEAKDGALRKNQELIKELQQRDYILNDQQTNFQQEITRFKTQVAEQQNQINQLSMMREKARHELQSKEGQLNQQQAEISELHGALQRQREEHQMQLKELDEKFRVEKMQHEQMQNEQARKIQSLEGLRRQLESENDRVRQEYERITNALQSNISKTISQTVQENFQFKPADLQAKPEFGFRYQ